MYYLRMGRNFRTHARTSVSYSTILGLKRPFRDDCPTVHVCLCMNVACKNHNYIGTFEHSCVDVMGTYAYSRIELLGVQCIHRPSSRRYSITERFIFTIPLHDTEKRGPFHSGSNSGREENITSQGGSEKLSLPVMYKIHRNLYQMYDHSRWCRGLFLSLFRIGGFRIGGRWQQCGKKESNSHTLETWYHLVA